MGIKLLTAIVFLASTLAAQPAPKPTNTLVVHVEGVNSKPGNIGVLVFNDPRGWPEDIHAALRDVVVPAHPGIVDVRIDNLPAGTYAIAVGHDVNLNHKVDKNFLGIPKEQWGMSNNPHALIRPPSFTTAQFRLSGNMELTIHLQ